MDVCQPDITASAVEVTIAEANSRLVREAIVDPLFLRANTGSLRATALPGTDMVLLQIVAESPNLRRVGRMAIAPVLKTGARKGLGVRVPHSPSLAPGVFSQPVYLPLTFPEASCNARVAAIRCWRRLCNLGSG